MLNGGRRRTALPRHQTLRANLHWSTSALESERVVLQRLSIFLGRFARGRHHCGGKLRSRPCMVVECVSNRVSKSLVTAHIIDAAMCYSLRTTTRAYAREKLASRASLTKSRAGTEAHGSA